MKKEVIIAISVGLVLGLIITFGIYIANQAVKKQNQTTNLPSNGTHPSPSATTAGKLEITEPEDNLVVSQSKITVSGITEAKNAVAVLTEKSEELVLADEEGVFSSEVVLVSGANEIKIISIDKNNQKQEKILTIVYTTAKIE